MLYNYWIAFLKSSELYNKNNGFYASEINRLF